MKWNQHKRTLTLGIGLLLFGVNVFCAEKTDSTVMNRIWSYGKTLPEEMRDSTSNAYLRYTIHTKRRNPILFLVPSMYTIAKGKRHFVGEAYGKLQVEENNHFTFNRQLTSGTVPHNRSVMPIVLEYLTPAIYEKTLYHDHLLSPFHRSNRLFYHYETEDIGQGLTKILFRPRLRNTQLIRGTAVVNNSDGRIIYSDFQGNYDMLSFMVSLAPGSDQNMQRLPMKCVTEAHFDFLGNKIGATFQAEYNCETTLPDSLNNHSDRKMMAQLRPVPLTKAEKEIYSHYDEPVTSTDTTETRKNSIGQLAFDVIGEHLIRSIGGETKSASFRLSPLLNPQYVSYSDRRGLSYKLSLGMQYNWNAHRYLTFSPYVGYNFKINQLYFKAPLRMNYNPKRHGYAEISLANGNRINSWTVIDRIHEAGVQIPEELANRLSQFDDTHLRVVNNVEIFDWLEVTTGFVFHQRKAVERKLMKEAGHPVVYRSSSPLLTLHVKPWRQGPVITANYERSIKSILRSNLEYERWEFDVSYQQRLNCMRKLNFRFGSGFYTNQKTSYFVDYSNFRDENLPNGWDDDWTGQFQLLSSSWYNASDHYVRGHVSYESPLLCLSWLPFFGRYIETERLYLSSLSIQHTRQYTEIGYGFTNRFFSMGIFASFLNRQYQDFGCKFTFELFRKW